MLSPIYNLIFTLKNLWVYNWTDAKHRDLQALCWVELVLNKFWVIPGLHMVSCDRALLELPLWECSRGPRLNLFSFLTYRTPDWSRPFPRTDIMHNEHPQLTVGVCRLPPPAMAEGMEGKLQSQGLVLKPPCSRHSCVRRPTTPNWTNHYPLRAALNTQHWTASEKFWTAGHRICNQPKI